jgi:hypothetical protein
VGVFNAALILLALLAAGVVSYLNAEGTGDETGAALYYI